MKYSLYISNHKRLMTGRNKAQIRNTVPSVFIYFILTNNKNLSHGIPTGFLLEVPHTHRYLDIYLYPRDLVRVMTKKKIFSKCAVGTLGPQHQMFQFYTPIFAILNYLLMCADLNICFSSSNSCPLKLADTEHGQCTAQKANWWVQLYLIRMQYKMLLDFSLSQHKHYSKANSNPEYISLRPQASPNRCFC